MFILAPHLLFALSLLAVVIASPTPLPLLGLLAIYPLGLHHSYRRGGNLPRALETALAMILAGVSPLLAIAQGEHYLMGLQYWLAGMLLIRAFRRMDKRDYAFCFLIAAGLFAHVGRVYSELPFLFLTLAMVFLLPYALFYFLAYYGGFRKMATFTPPGRLPLTAALARSMTVISLLLMVLMVVLFLLIPRGTAGFGLAQRQTGFSDNVRLGSFNRITQQRRIVMLVETEQPDLWRGGVLDYYADGAWHSTVKISVWRPPGTIPVSNPEAFPVTRRFKILDLRAVANQLFSAGNIRSVERLRGPRYLFINDLYTVPFVRPMDVVEPQVEYRVTSEISTYLGWPEPRTRRHRIPTNPDEYIRENELPLQLPTNLSARVRALALTLTRDLDTPEARADAVQRYLNTNCTYTTEGLDSGGMDPLDFFLFESRSGHCEYFATAMVILLRAAGVPARAVQGFAPGTYVEGSYLVRLSDAHLWAEVFVAGRGWRTYDPTPGGEERLRGFGTPTLLERLRLKWLTYVLEYDGIMQANLFGHVRTRARQASAGLLGVLPAPRHLLTILLAVAVVAALTTLVRRLDLRLPRFNGLRRNSPQGRAARVRSDFGAYLKALARQGYKRLPGTTPNDLLRQLSDTAAPILDDARQLTELFYQTRFGGAPLSPADAAAAHAALRRIRRWSHGRPPQPPRTA